MAVEDRQCISVLDYFVIPRGVFWLGNKLFLLICRSHAECTSLTGTYNVQQLKIE